MDNTTASAPDLFGLIAEVESKGNCKAVRFEPATYQNLSAGRTDKQKTIIARIQEANSCSWGTALMIYSTSWGAVQIMGFNLYSGNCQVSTNVIDFCDDIDAQKRAFWGLIGIMGLTDCTPQRLADSPELRDHFGIVYNGSAAYASAIVDALKTFNFAVKE